jgi:hypothetical protein
MTPTSEKYPWHGIRERRWKYAMGKVSVARDSGTQVEVRDGVKEGDIVILNPQVDLVEGSRVQAQPQTAEAGR